MVSKSTIVPRHCAPTGTRRKCPSSNPDGCRRFRRVSSVRGPYSCVTSSLTSFFNIRSHRGINSVHCKSPVPSIFNSYEFALVLQKPSFQNRQLHHTHSSTAPLHVSTTTKERGLHLEFTSDPIPHTVTRTATSVEYRTRRHLFYSLVWAHATAWLTFDHKRRQTARGRHIAVWSTLPCQIQQIRVYLFVL